MGIKNFEHWTCDLCATTENGLRNKNALKGWIKFTIEDSMLDRAFHEKCLCPNCLREISRAMKN